MPFPLRVLRRAVVGVAILALFAASAPPAHAAITASGTVISVQTPPPNVGAIGNADGNLDSNELESSSSIFVWFERARVTTIALTTNHDGTVGNSGSPTAGSIAANSAVESYYIHFDRAGSGPPTTLNNAAQQYITFDQQILGLVFTNSTLGAADGQLAPTLSPQYYGSLTSRATEASDQWTITSTGTTWTLVINSLTTSGAAVDGIRVITAAPLSVPEPGTWALFALGTLGLGGFVGRRRRKRRRAAHTEPVEEPASA